VPTGISRLPTAVRFALGAGAWSLGLFGLLRLGWIETQLVLPFTRAQAGMAAKLFGTPTAPVEATLACSGTDALALCLGAVLAYPVRWRARLVGAALGAALIVGLNTARIGTLGLLADAPAKFERVHLYLWPAVLTLAIALYVMGWMRFADRRELPEEGATAHPESAVARPARRFAGLTIAFLLLFVVAAPLYLGSSSLLALGGFMARVAAATLRGLGVAGAHAQGNLLLVPNGGFVVTQECVATPLIPVYLAAVCAYATRWRWTILGLLAALPIFTALGVARLLVVAVPSSWTASPQSLVHAFYQVILAAVIVFLAALWRHGRDNALRHALLGGGVALLFVLLLAPFYTRLVLGLARAPVDDPQGAIALLPAFQVALFLALWGAAALHAGWRRLVAGLAMLAFSQAAGLLALYAFTVHAGLAAHVRDVRGWAVAGPVLVFAAAVQGGRARS
jgi:exosortase/archaeosortase family protein